VLLKIVYVFTCRVLSLAVLAFGGDPAKDAGLLDPVQISLRACPGSAWARKCGAGPAALYRFKTRRMASDLRFVRSATRPGSCGCRNLCHQAILMNHAAAARSRR
jgi:hypothetical protein